MLRRFQSGQLALAEKDVSAIKNAVQHNPRESGRWSLKSRESYSAERVNRGSLLLRKSTTLLIGIGWILHNCAALGRNVLFAMRKRQRFERKFKLIVAGVRTEKL